MDSFSQQLGIEWYSLLKEEFDKEYMDVLGRRLGSVRDRMTPVLADIFKAYQYVQPSQLKVLIIGQDPYPTPGVAHGLAFSYHGTSIPKSLKIIFDELEAEGYGKRTGADLTDWAKQGVMLLNTVLTTTQGESFAHKNWGWEPFIAATLRKISLLKHPFVVMAWGSPAQDIVRKYIDVDPVERLILTTCHPMAQQYNPKIKFIGCNHFTKANDHLLNYGLEPVSWV